MIYSDQDPCNNADRYDVLIHPQDARELRIAEGEGIVVYNKYGTFQGRARFAETKRGNVQVYWPEGNVLIPKGVYETYAGIPEFNTAVKIEKADTFHANEDSKYKEKQLEDLEVNVG